MAHDADARRAAARIAFSVTVGGPPLNVPRFDRPPIVLRPFRHSDAGLIQLAASDPLIPLITTVPTSDDLSSAQAFLDRQQQRAETGTGYSFAIADHLSDLAMGQIGLWLRDIEYGRASIGYWIAEPYRRRGLAGRALSAACNWALTLDHVQRLELYVEPWNEGSWRAAERAGFAREGLLRSWQKVGAERRDMYMYSRLRPAGLS